MKVFLLRHGEKEDGYYWNDGIGIKDNPLSENGIIESNRLISYFLNLNIEQVYVSEYQRTKETIATFCKIKGIEPITTGILNEIDMGEFNLVKDGIDHQKYFKEWDRFQKKRRDFRYKGGESGKEALKRVAKFFRIIEKETANIIVVTHMGWIKLAICHILEIDVGKRFCFGDVPTCSIMEIEYEEDAKKWKINCINQKGTET